MKAFGRKNFFIGANFGDIEDEERRRSNWANYPGQERLQAVTEFSFKEYQRLLYEDDGVTPRVVKFLGQKSN